MVYLCIYTAGDDADAGDENSDPSTTTTTTAAATSAAAAGDGGVRVSSTDCVQQQSTTSIGGGRRQGGLDRVRATDGTRQRTRRVHHRRNQRRIRSVALLQATFHHAILV